jgi:hypothetical protein
MKKDLRLIAGAALLMLAAASCDRSPVQPQAPAAKIPVHLDGDPRTDSLGIDTGYFGSGHYTPPDTLAEGPS